MSFESKHFESLETINLLKKYEQEYADLKQNSPEKAREYLIRASEGIDMHLGNEVLKEELNNFTKHDLKYLQRELSALLEKDEAEA